MRSQIGTGMSIGAVHLKLHICSRIMNFYITLFIQLEQAMIRNLIRWLSVLWLHWSEVIFSYNLLHMLSYHFEDI